MNPRALAGLAAAALAAAAGAILFLWPAPTTGPAPIAYGRDACALCRMTLTQPGFGGELRDAAGRATMYDDLGCLLRAYAAPGPRPPGAWVETLGGPGLVPLDRAAFVQGSRRATPMGYGIVGLADAAAAREFAAREGGEVLEPADLFAWVQAMFPATPPQPAAPAGPPGP